jgi:hypothetical protein
MAGLYSAKRGNPYMPSRADAPMDQAPLSERENRKATKLNPVISILGIIGFSFIAGMSFIVGVQHLHSPKADYFWLYELATGAFLFLLALSWGLELVKGHLSSKKPRDNAGSGG